MGRKGVWLRAIFLAALFLGGFAAGHTLYDRILETRGDGSGNGGDEPCPLSHGWWKTHPDTWRVDSLRLGAQEYNRTALLVLLGISTDGDASVVLARQLIAAKLNVASGSDPSGEADSISRADDLLWGFDGPLPYGIPASTPQGNAMVTAAATLEDYNTGRLTPGCEAPVPP